MPKDTQKARRSPSPARRATRLNPPSRSGPVTRSQTRAAASAQRQRWTPLSPLTNKPRRKKGRRPALSGPATGGGSPAPSRNSGSTSLVDGREVPNPPTLSATPAAGCTGPTSGIFDNAHHVVLNQPTFVGEIRHKKGASLDLLINNVIPGAQFDSGERYPPPSCHPGTRLDISEKLILWLQDLMREHKIVWLHGPAGVGKSAVIQTLAQSEARSPTSTLGATVFFSRSSKRDDPQRVFFTIAYQLAVKYPPYRAYVGGLLADDPLLVKKSIVEQFNWLIIKPFAEKKLLEGTQRTVLITLDGLDECNGEAAQRELIFLIGKFCLEHPIAPLIWLIASRPEPPIHTAFARHDIQGAYMGVEMAVNADQAHRDVEVYLRDKLAEIKEKYPMSFCPTQQWPTETDFTKISKRSSGLFAFATAAVRFTDDPEYANPVSQLQKILDILESPSSAAEEDSPFAALDALYSLILSSISPKVWPTTRKLLHLMTEEKDFLYICNLISITQNEAYAALQKLHAVLRIPEPHRADRSKISVFHQSFDDYLRSPSRSGLFWIDPKETEKLKLSASIRILLGAHDLAHSTIRPMNTTASWLMNDPWSHHLMDLDVRRLYIFSWALHIVIYTPPNKAKELDGLRAFFHDIDYANFRDYLPFNTGLNRPMESLLTLLLTPCLEEWGVLTNVEIRSLDYDSYDMNHPVYEWGPKLQPPADTVAAVLFPPWSYENCNRPQRDQVCRSIKSLPLSHPAVVLGKGNKSVVFIGVENYIYGFRHKLA